MRTLTNVTGVVVGGGRGIGAAVVERLVQEGARVWVLDADVVSSRHNHYGSTDIQGYTAAEALVGRYPGHVEAMKVDASQEPQVQEAFSAIWAKERPQILVNAVGIQVMSRAVDTSLEQARALLSTNFVAPFLTCREAVARWKGHMPEWASIINLGSIAAKIPFTDVSVYGATKAALAAFSTSLAVELAQEGFNIQVNTVCPGIVRTAMWEYIENEFRQGGESHEAFWGRMCQMIPQGHPQSPEGVADVVLALVRNPFVTGQSVSVDGGMNRHA